MNPRLLPILVLACTLPGIANAAAPAIEYDPVKPGIAEQLRAAENFAAIATLGEKLFNDVSLSVPAGQSCASCHEASIGFVDPDRDEPTSQGALGGETFGKRNTPSVMYAAFSPEPQRTVIPEQQAFVTVGGQFWDGRAKNLVEQAKLPFLDPLEMNQPDAAALVAAVRKTPYADEFKAVFGGDAFADTDTAYENIGKAIAAFELTPRFAPFDAKYDRVKAGKASFTTAEARGEEAFHGKAQCGRCHFTPEHVGPQVFTTFQYFNVGSPANPNSRFAAANPNFVDLGNGVLPRGQRHSEKGAFKVPTLRNVEVTGPYMHNGFFDTLEDVVLFYNRSEFMPEYAESVTDGGFYITSGLDLSDQEMADIVAFLKTLTDSHLKPAAP